MKLNDSVVKNSKPKDKDYKLSDGAGLFLLIRTNGGKYWRLKYRFNKKEKLLALGIYPDVTLKEAREKTGQARKLLQNNIDQSQQKKKEKVAAEKNSLNTFESVAREWYANRKSIWKPRYAEDVLKRLDDDIFPQIGSLPITEIEPPLLLSVIRRIENRGAHELAKRQLKKCGEIFRYAIACGKGNRDPSPDIKEALKPYNKQHYAALDVSELPEFIQSLNQNDARLYQGTRNAIKVMMLTFVRTGELINAEWNEFDFPKAKWVIPAERMKMGKEHIVPLAKQTIEILEDQKLISRQWPLVFPSAVKPRNPISNNTILGAIKRLGYQYRMTGHGFRALAMSAIKQELGYRHEVVDRQLAHVPRSKIDKAYDRAMFLEERMKMMQDWADYLDSLH